MILTEAAHTFLRIGKEFHGRGWVLGTSGNFSTVLSRDPLRLAITASSVDKGMLESRHILEVDGEGRNAGVAAGRPSAETLLHLAIVRQTGAGAVLHTHSVWSTILSDFFMKDGGMAIEGYEMLKGLDGIATHDHREWLPIVGNNQDMAALAAEATVLLESRPSIHGLLVHRHGLYTWAPSLEAAIRQIEIFEFLMEAVGRRQMMEARL